MTKREIIKKTEKFVKGEFSKNEKEGHGFDHVDRVRKWARKIGKIEGDVDLFLLEMSALLHDIGKAYEKPGLSHYTLGREMSQKYLESLDYFKVEEIDVISQAVYEHGPGGKSQLTKILQDADRMDLWGAVQIARVFAHWHKKPIYTDRSSFAYKKLSKQGIDIICKNKELIRCVLDELNVALNIYNVVNTKTAKKLAEDKVDFLKLFIKQLKKETIDL